MPPDDASPRSSLPAEIGPLADANCIVLCLDGRERIIFLNPFGLNFFGYQQAEVLGEPARGTLFAEDSNDTPFPRNRKGKSKAIVGNTPHRICECRRKNGESAWVVWSSQVLADGDGKFETRLCIGHDLTDAIVHGTERGADKTDENLSIQHRQSRLQALRAQLKEEQQAHADDKRALKESQDRYRLFSAVTSEGVLFHDNGVALEVNEAFVGMAECPREQIIGMDIVSRFISPADATRVKRKLDASDDQLYEATARSIKGRLFPVEIRSRPGQLDGRPCRVVCVRDISHRKKTERQMIQAQKMEAIGTLASGIAHDFNNMLAGIQGNVEVIRHQLAATSPHQKGLDLISNIVERGARLSGQILGYARGGQSELTEIDLNRLVKDAIEMFGSAKKEVDIQTHLTDETPAIKGDPTQVEQVLLNLMINAVHAMPMGGTLTIETKPTVLTSDTDRPYEIIPGDYAMLVVQDTGHGMDRKTQKRIFEPFFTTKGKGQGTGLGLASTYGIVKSHKGYIDVSSEPGVGSRLSVLLPAASVREDPTPADTAKEKRKQTILMVDDEADFLLLGRQMLSLLGYQPVTAGTCEEAVARFEQSNAKIDLVIMDMIMPDGAVDKTIERLRDLDPGLRILLSSGHSPSGEIGHRVMQHCDGFIQKPFRLALLSQKIKELLGIADDEDQ
mgnify:CR=1 FL=1